MGSGIATVLDIAERYFNAVRGCFTDAMTAKDPSQPGAAAPAPAAPPAHRSLLARMRTAISSSESPLNWTGAGLMVVSGAAAAGLGELTTTARCP